jgi:flagellum-specific ATP synthase
VYRQSEDLINLGAYVSGANPRIDSAIKARPEILTFLRQGSHDVSPISDTLSRMESLAGMVS